MYVVTQVAQLSVEGLGEASPLVPQSVAFFDSQLRTSKQGICHAPAFHTLEVSALAYVKALVALFWKPRMGPATQECIWLRQLQ